MRAGIALVVSAPSGTGKSTLCAKLAERFPNLSFSVSCTTRAMRKGEIEGKDYYFLPKTDFLERRGKGYFAEWAIVHDNYYGTPLAPCRELLSNGRDLLFDIDVQGAAQIKLALPLSVFIFILPPSLDELARRLKTRGTDSDGAISLRLRNAVQEIQSAPWYDYIIVNDELEKAFEELCRIYEAACLSSSCNRHMITKLLAESQSV